MNNLQADQYFLKALDNYNYDLNATYESLHYALSYDEFHAQSNCLMGVLYMYWFKNYKEAAHYFEMSLIGDKGYVDAYKHFCLLKIWLGDFDRAQKLIDAGLKVKGMNRTVLYKLKATIYELGGGYKEGKKLLQRSYQLTQCNPSAEYFENELSRLKKKIKKRKKGK